MNRLKICLNLFLTFFALQIFAGESFIPLEEVRLPSDDLIFNGKTLKAEDALIFSKQGVISDLSNLDPKENDIWNRNIQNVEDVILRNLNTIDELQFEGIIASQSGLLRFNVRPEFDTQIFTVHLDKTLHTLLLRAALLKKLGYKIPDLIHKKTIKIRFQSEEDKKNFIEKQIVENTLASSKRWIVAEDLTSVILKDVAISKPSENDFYNVAFGVPMLPINSRTIRSLLIPYALLDLGESLNQFRWVAGRIDNKNIVLNHFFNYQFTTSIDDARWILKLLNRLKRNDFKSIVAEAQFPESIQPLIVEKLIARRNSLIELTNAGLEKIEVDQNISFKDVVKDGKLIQKEFPEYATRFAFGDAESPLEELNYFFYSKLQANFIDNATTLLNDKIKAFDINKKREEYFVKQFEEGLKHYLETGEFKPIETGYWVSPYLNGNLILSRDIILGNYLGTNNLIQMADTFGGSLSLGLNVGIEGFAQDYTGAFKAGISLVRTYSHIRPVKTLKSSLKEPYKNIFANLLKKSLREKFFNISELSKLQDSTDRTEKVTELLKEISEKLDVGESLIITDRFMPSAMVRVAFNQGLVSAGLSVDASHITIKRMHLLKRSPTLLQIYDDKGSMVEIGITLDVRKFIPILTVRGSVDKGKYKAEVYNVNLDSNLEENPHFFTNSLGVYEVLKNNNFEVLEQNQKPTVLSASFSDKELNASFLLWKGKKQVGKAVYDVKTGTGFSGKYLSVNKSSLGGFNLELFVRRVANYYLSEANENLIITEDQDQRPQDTFMGKATTDTSRFEAEIQTDGSLTKRFIAISKEKQGWSISERKIKKFMEEVNGRFQSTLFNVSDIDFNKLRLYNLSFNVNVYDKGISVIDHVNIDAIKQLEKKYQSTTRVCTQEAKRHRRAECGDLSAIKSKIRSCPTLTDHREYGECQLELIERLFNDLDFSDFSTLVGKDNFYAFAAIDGFRSESEVLKDTIFSNSLGEIGSRYVQGPLDKVRELIGVQGGEFRGSWIRRE